MASSTRSRTWIRRTAPLAAALMALAVLAACGSDDSKGGDSSGGKVKVALITKDSINPFFVAMQEGAKKAATENDVDLTVGAGAQDGDEEGQIQLIENAIAAGDDGILITPNGPGVNSAIKKARDAGLYVIALDTPPDPADTVDITFATDNFKAGELIGGWAAKKLDGKDVVIALLDLFDDKVVSVDYNRDQGFLTGMGIDVKDKAKNGDEAPTGTYSGGNYTIACNEPTNGAQPDGKTAMERCLAKNPDINLVYSINEPAGIGASEALAAAGKKATIVSVDGGCLGVSKVADGTLAATSQQYPLKMAQLGVEAIAKIAKGGDKPATTAGLDFFDTGTALVTDSPVDGVESISSADASKICWGTVG
jgi:fructose transport system substrate-binding protein